MTTPVPAAPTVVPTPPDRTDRPTFNARVVGIFDYIKNTMWTEITAYIANAYANASSAYTSASAAALSETNAASSAGSAANNAAAAAASAGATLWVAGSYTAGQSRCSPLTQRIYRVRVNHTGSTDPSLDGINWGLIDAGLVKVEVATASVTAVSGNHYFLIGVTGAPLSAQAVVLSATPADGDEIKISPANGLLTNSFDLGAKPVRGPAISASGVITIDIAAPVHLKFISSLNQWEML